MRVRELFEDVRGSLGTMELRAALKSAEGKKIRAKLAFACTGDQRKALRYLFPNERVDFFKEVIQGRTLEWLKRV